jgi:hypothetical protein
VRQAEGLELPDMDGVAFRAWWTLATRLDRLSADGTITQAAYAAACRFRADRERVAVCSGSRMDRFGERVAGDAGDRHGDMLDRVATTRRLRAARARIGAGRYALIYWVAVEDLSWCEMGRRLRVSDGKARRAAAKAIERLEAAAVSFDHQKPMG